MLSRRSCLVAALAGVVFAGGTSQAHADAPPKAEVMVIHATKCPEKEKRVDPEIGDAPRSLGYDCMKLIEKKVLPLAINQPSTMPLPNGRTFQLVHTAKVDNRFKVTASISAPGGGG